MAAGRIRKIKGTRRLAALSLGGAGSGRSALLLFRQLDLGFIATATMALEATMSVPHGGPAAMRQETSPSITLIGERAGPVSEDS